MASNIYKSLLDNSVKELPIKLDKEESNLLHWKRMTEDTLSQYGACTLLLSDQGKLTGAAEQADKKIVILLKTSVHESLSSNMSQHIDLDTSYKIYHHILGQFSTDPVMAIKQKANLFYEVASAIPNALEIESHMTKVFDAFKDLLSASAGTQSYDYAAHPELVVIEFMCALLPVEKVGERITLETPLGVPKSLVTV